MTTEERPNKLIVDVSTGEETLVPLTDEEMAEREQARIEFEEQIALRQAETEAKEAARQSGIAKLMALGLTEEEANSLVK